MPDSIAVSPVTIAVCGAETVVWLCPFPNTYMYPSYLLSYVRYPSATAPADPPPEMSHMYSPVVALSAHSLHPLARGSVGECSPFA